MNPRIGELLARLRQIEDEIEQEMQRRGAELHVEFDARRAYFARDVLERQKRLRVGLVRYLRASEWRNVVSAPFIYAMIVPIVFADLTVSLYQRICFPLYGIARVRRADYLLFDRADLVYLNPLEKLNCAYCSYGNGVVAYMREVFARTEQYWCPIKHARRQLQAHAHYSDFADYGDAEGFRASVNELRQRLRELDQPRHPGQEDKP